MFEKALKGNNYYWMWLAFLGFIIAIGGISYLRQYFYGLGITGLSRDVSWGIYIAQFTFLVGVAAGGGGGAAHRTPGVRGRSGHRSGRAAAWRGLRCCRAERSSGFRGTGQGRHEGGPREIRPNDQMCSGKFTRGR